MAENDPHPGAAPAVLHGLVLAGGRSTRFGSDKGSLDYHGLPQAGWALALLEAFCAQVFVSVRPEQAGTPPYADLPLILDRDPGAGPASGLAAALSRFPSAAWLTVAADMPLLAPALLAELVAQRDPTALATAYRHRDGTPEPLCAIWEPAVRARLDAHGAPEGVSLRRLLQVGPARFLTLADDIPLMSVNTAAEDARVRQLLRTDSAPYVKS